MSSNWPQSQQKIKEQARQLKQKLLQVKKKKQSQYQQSIREELSQIYNQKFQQFKKQLEEQFTSQLASLDLANEFRMAEIIDVEQRIRDSIKKIDDQEKKLKEKEVDLELGYQDALAFLNQQKEEEMREIKLRMEQKYAEKIESYKDRIDIE